MSWPTEFALFGKLLGTYVVTTAIGALVDLGPSQFSSCTEDFLELTVNWRCGVIE
jgi:hypothetical protein